MRRFTGLSAVLIQFTLPGILAAQVAGGVEFFGTLDSSDPITRTMGGMALSVGSPFIGIRGSGALGISSVGPQGGLEGPSTLAWATDADLVLGPVNAGLGVGFMPYTFAGAGLMSSAYPDRFTDAIRTWSYGGGVQLALGRILSVNGEVRSRHLAASATYADSQFVRGLEYRIGIGLHFGAGGGRSPSYSRGRIERSPAPPRAPRPRTRSRPRPTTWPISSAGGAAAARRVVPEGERYIGVPYKWGGSSPRTGFDCSGFVQYIYGSQGVDLPRTSRQMAGAGFAVSTAIRSLEIGDLMLFAQNGTINHVAVYAGEGRILHSSSSGGGVRYDRLSTARGKWFANRLVAVRRVSGDRRIIANALVSASEIPFVGFDTPDSAPPPRR
ncbi:MAG TPA: C40 family peptidase [Gemmatimonadaceae bacterium]|nr:C40 family peptidase [Gemmatimonadaceae bacterium]